MINYIYVLKDPISLKIRYVGKTSNPNNRIYRHMSDYSLAESWTKKNKWLLHLKKLNLVPIMEIIDEANDNDVNDLEKKWIKHFKENGIKLTNMTDGGDGYDWTGKNHTKESIRKIKMNHPLRKEIIQLNLDNKIIKIYESIHDCDRELGFHRSHISKCCKRINQTVKGHYFRFIDNYFPCSKSKSSPNMDYINSEIEKYRSLIVKTKSKKEKLKERPKINKKSKKIVQYNLDGTVVNRFNSLSESRDKSGCHIYLIDSCCKKKSYYTTKGYTFRYEGDPFDYIPYNKSIQITSKRVCKYDLDGKILKIYDSIKQAAKEIKDRDSNIIKCCKNKVRNNGNPIIVKGYTWRYFEDTKGMDLNI